jgi:hypothetical protein
MHLGVIGLVIVLASCASCASPAYRSNVPSSGPELLAVLFKEGRPLTTDTLMTAVTDPQWTVEALAKDAKIINSIPQLKFQVDGTTDNQECPATDCVSLSLRRARLTHDWLVSHGVPAPRLLAPRGMGSSTPLTDNATETSRSANRRAVVNYVLE